MYSRIISNRLTFITNVAYNNVRNSVLSMSDFVLFSSTRVCLIAARCSIFKSTTLKIVGCQNMYRLLSAFKMSNHLLIPFVGKQLFFRSSFNIFWMATRVYTTCRVYRSLIKEDIVGWFLSLTTQFYTLCFYTVKHFVDIDESYF